MDNLFQHRLSLARDNQIGPGKRCGMVMTQSGVFSPQDHRDIRKHRPDHGNGFRHPGGPVGHQGGDKNQIRRIHGRQVFVKPFRKDSVPGKGLPGPGKRPGRRRQHLRQGHRGFAERPPAVQGCFHRPGLKGMKPVQTVDETDPDTGPAQHTGQAQQAQGFQPEIKRGKVVNPGIHAQDMGRIRHGIDQSSKYFMEVFFSSFLENSRL